MVVIDIFYIYYSVVFISFYHAMHIVQSAALPSYVVCLYVHLSVTLVICGRVGRVTSKAIAHIISLGYSLLRAPTSQFSTRGTSPNFTWNRGIFRSPPQKCECQQRRCSLRILVSGSIRFMPIFTRDPWRGASNNSGILENVDFECFWMLYLRNFKK